MVTIGADLISAVLVADAPDREANLDWEAGFKYIETATADDLAWQDMDNMGYCDVEVDEATGEVPTEDGLAELRSTFKYALEDIQGTIEGWSRILNVYDLFGKKFYFIAETSWGDCGSEIENASILMFSDGLMKAVGFATDFRAPLEVENERLRAELEQIRNSF